MNKEEFYITTSIAYTNAPPHIGFSLESIQADVIARYHRLLGEDVFFLTGTDEHGSKIAKTAEEEGKEPQKFVDEITERFKSLKGILNLSNDDFIRTTNRQRHWPGVEKVWLQLKEKGDIYRKEYKGLYCSGCEAFITKKDLVDGKCQNHQKEPEIIEEENWFFRLSKYSDKIKDIIETGIIKIIPKGKRNENLSFIKQGLEDISFSRSRKNLSWGIPVPDDEDQIIYVWSDALVNYISALGYGQNERNFEKYWPADVHCIGKDIQKFHCLIWPAMLLSLGLPLPKVILIHGFITIDNQKMSKSLGNIVDPFELVKKYGTDPVRYFLLREIPSTEDGDFTYDKFEARYNDDLAKGLGNLVARMLTMVENGCDNKVPQVDIAKTGLNTIRSYTSKTKEATFNFRGAAEQKHRDIACFLEEFEFNNALAAISNLVKKCDIYIDYYKLYKYNPSKENEGNKETIEIAFYDVLETLRHIAWMILPFLPETADKIFKKLGLDPVAEKLKNFEEAKKWGGLTLGIKINKGKPLFPRIK